MIIGQDFEKVHAHIFGIEMLEPNALITDTIMAVISLILAYLVRKNFDKQTFTNYWYLFFLVFGISSFFGGLGHAFFGYWGVNGKFFTWITGILSIYFIEKAMISALNNLKMRNILNKIAFIKLIVVFAVFSLICITQPISTKPEIGFLPIAFNTIFGVILSAGILGYHLSKRQNIDFKHFYFGVLIMMPSAILFLGKINLHPLFDKNDFSHVLLTAGILFFYKGVASVSNNIKYITA